MYNERQTYLVNEESSSDDAEESDSDEESGSAVAVPNKGSECLEELLVKLTEREDLTVLGPALQLIKALWADEQMKEPTKEPQSSAPGKKSIQKFPHLST